MTRVALRSVRTHIGQFLLTVLAVVLGVTFLSGTLALRGVLSDTFSALTSSTMTAAWTAFSMVGPMVKTPCLARRIAGLCPMFSTICTPISSVPMAA